MVPAESVESIDDMFAQDAFWEVGVESTFFATDRLVTNAVLHRLSKAFRNLEALFIDVLWTLLVDLEWS